VDQGYSFIDLMAATAIAAIMFGAAVPLAHSTIDRSRVSAAAAYMSGRVALTRAEAVKRSAFVAIQFVSRNDGYWFRSYLDGNHNGVGFSQGSYRVSKFRVRSSEFRIQSAKFYYSEDSFLLR
jgi:Tfp pilus assembly protein FimT